MLAIRAALFVFGLPAVAAAQVDHLPPNTDFEPAFENQTRAPALRPTTVRTSIWVEGLDHPWGIASLPDGSFLVTERSGRLRLVSASGALSEPIAGVPEVENRDQGGLLDVAVQDDFAETRRVWLTYAKPVVDGFATAAATGVLSEDGTDLTEVEDIFVQAPPSWSASHYGSRIVFEPGGENAFITTGERIADTLAQDLSTTYGKIVRVDALTGEPPPDNPFDGAGAAIWSFGHRNVQGAAIGPDGALWTVEHGPRGGDELNRPEAGANYGWPVISYGENYDETPIGAGRTEAPDMEQPVYYWDPVIAPGGMIFYDGDGFDWRGDILVSGLTGMAVVRLRLENGRVVGEERVGDGIGRVRDVEQAPDGSVLALIDAAAPGGAIVRIAPPG